MENKKKGAYRRRIRIEIYSLRIDNERLKDRFKMDSVVARHGCCHVAEEQ